MRSPLLLLCAPFLALPSVHAATAPNATATAKTSTTFVRTATINTRPLDQQGGVESDFYTDAATVQLLARNELQLQEPADPDVQLGLAAVAATPPDYKAARHHYRKAA